MNKTLAFLTTFAVGAVCAAFLLWLWQENREGQHQLRLAREAVASPGAVSPAVPATAVALSPTAQALLDQLQSLLVRPDTRAKEGLLTFKDDDAYRRFLARARAAGLTILGELPDLRTVRVRYEAFAALRAELAQNAADYAKVSANYLVNIPSGPATPAKEDRAAISQVPFGNSALAFLGVPTEHGAWGAGVTIAILDTGVLPDATFGSGRLRTLDIGLGTVAGRGEDDGHGTAVAALAAGASPDAPGVAPSASLLSIRVTDTNGTSDTFTIAQALLAAVNAGAKVINVSLGGYSTTAALDAAIGYAVERGTVIVAAAGNDQAAQLAWPAADSRVVSVGAVDRAGQQVTFSNSGSQLCLTAPGYGVQTAWLDGQRVYVDSTSASAPLVSGAIAAALSQNASLTPQTAAQLLQ
ncbi:MAG: S8 family serine peptidase, partial [Verrucomicrobia bacterium]|nr:S8 family serine peptidase [Verrucomicrobiota bacterium]